MSKRRETQEVNYWIIVNTTRNVVWAKNGVHFWSWEDAQRELETLGAGWEIEEQSCWTSSKKNDSW